MKGLYHLKRIEVHTELLLHPCRHRLLHAQAWLGEASAGLLSPGIPRPKGKTGEGRSAPLVVRDLLRAELRIQVLEDALRWCGGSADFAPGGQAHKQWLNVSRLLGPERARAKR